MRITLWSFLMVLLLASCSKEYQYADEMIDFYEDVLDDYEDAESLDELNTLREQAFQTKTQIENEFQDSHDELTLDMEQFDEDAYLIHLRLLTAESHVQWMYTKRKKELEQEK